MTTSDTITMHLVSEEISPEDSDWQAECRQLYTRMVDALETGTLTPLERETAPGSKTDMVQLFHQLVTSGISIGAFAGLFHLAKLWLEQRSRCDVVLTFPDGSALHIKGLSWQEAEQKLLQHQQRLDPAAPDRNAGNGPLQRQHSQEG